MTETSQKLKLNLESLLEKDTKVKILGKYKYIGEMFKNINLKKNSTKNFKILLANKKLLITGSTLIIFLLLRNRLIIPPVFAFEEIIKKKFEEGAGDSSAVAPITKYGKFKELVYSLSGAKIFLDPSAPTIKKISTGARLGCCTSAIVLGAIAESLPKGSKLKLALTTCCTFGWGSYAYLQYLDMNKKK